MDLQNHNNLRTTEICVALDLRVAIAECPALAGDWCRQGLACAGQLAGFFVFLLNLPYLQLLSILPALVAQLSLQRAYTEMCHLDAPRTSLGASSTLEGWPGAVH